MSDKKPENKNTSMTPVYIYFVLALLAIVLLLGFYIFGKNRQRAEGPAKPPPTLPDVTGTLTAGLQNKVSANKPVINAKKYNCSNVKNLLNAVPNKFPGKVGIIFHDFQSGCHVEINPDKSFESASLAKLPVMLTVYLEMDQGRINISHQIPLKESQKTGGSGTLKNEPAGSRWTVDRLLELMITESDNTATDVLIELVGMKKVEATCQEMGMKKTSLKRKIFDFARINQGLDNLTTPRDVYNFYRMLYEGCPIFPRGRASMLNRLKRQKRNEIIPRDLPEGVECAHKTGSLTGVLHDGGIIYPPGGRKPYVLILMSQNLTNQKAAKETFAKTSGLIYRELMGSAGKLPNKKENPKKTEDKKVSVKN